MEPHDEVCLCFRVPLKKLQTYLKTENPSKASLLSECLGAGTGCGWCVPYLEKLHELHVAGEPLDLNQPAESYAENRKAFHKTGEHPDAGPPA